MNRQSAHQLVFKENAVKDVTEFTKEKIDELKKLISEFEAKWEIGLIWDSKVPQNDKWFLNFMSFKAADREEVIKEIEVYLNLYKEIRCIENVKYATDDESIQNANLRIYDLYEKLSSIVERAKTEQETTSSSAVYNLHKAIIARNEQIINKIEKVEFSVSRQLIRGLTNKLESAVKACEKSEQQINTLQQENKEIKKECKLVVEENKKLAEKCDRGVEENKKLREDIKNLMQGIRLMINERAAENNANNLGDTIQEQPYAQGADAQTDQQQESDTPANEQTSSRLSEAQPIPHSRSSSTSSDGSDIEVINRSQC